MSGDHKLPVPSPDGATEIGRGRFRGTVAGMDCGDHEPVVIYRAVNGGFIVRTVEDFDNQAREALLRSDAESPPSSAGAAEPQSSLDPMDPWEAELEAMAAEPDAVLDGDVAGIIKTLRNPGPDARKYAEFFNKAANALERLSAPAVGVTREAIDDLRSILDWRGPDGQPHKKIVISRDRALNIIVAPAPDARVSEPDPIADLVARFSKALLAKLRLAKANGRSGWELDDWEAACQQGLLRHLEKGDPRDVAAYCAFMWHHGWITAAPQDVGREATIEEHLNRIHGAIADYADLQPEADESWESWYAAAFDMVSSKIKKQTDAIRSLSRKGGGQ